MSHRLRICKKLWDTRPLLNLTEELPANDPGGRHQPTKITNKQTYYNTGNHKLTNL